MKKLACLLTAFLYLILSFKPLEAAFDLSAFYGSVQGGVQFLDQARLNHINTNAKTGYFVGGALGYKSCYGFRLEGEVAYRRNSLHTLKIRSFDIAFDQPGRGHLDSVSYLANFLYDIPVCFCATPYVGIGLGYAHSRTHLHVSQDGSFFNASERKNGFAWQAIGGISYPVLKCTDLTLEYRYYQPEARRYQDHNLVMGLRVHF